MLFTYLSGTRFGTRLLEMPFLLVELSQRVNADALYRKAQIEYLFNLVFLKRG